MTRHKSSKTDVEKLAKEEERRKRFLLSHTYDLATDFPDEYAQLKLLDGLPLMIVAPESWTMTSGLQ